MPIPVLIWAGVAVATALTGVWKIRGASKRIKSARQRYARRRKSYEAFIAGYDRAQRLVKLRLEVLGKRRVSALVTLGEAVKFLEKAKLRERDLTAEFRVTPQRMHDWKNASINAKEVASGLGQSALSGAATASGVYGLVGMLASASTGTAISTLSGAAATNATLAWLGGGTLAAGGGGVAAGTMVFGGLVAGPAIAVAGFFADSKAEKIDTEIEKYLAELDCDQAEKEKIIAVLSVVKRRINELIRSTRRLQSELERLLSRCDPSLDEDAYLVARTASSLGDLLEVAILDKKGKPIEKGAAG